MVRPIQLDRRCVVRASAGALAMALAPAACARDAHAYDLRIGRDAGCSCCHAWSELMRQSGRFRVALIDEPDMAALKRRVGVPNDLASCHTAVVEGYVVEGHVPAEDVLRLLSQRPARVRGLAAPGMPLGSPGMEQPDGARDAFTVYAFEASGARFAFAHHGVA